MENERARKLTRLLAAGLAIVVLAVFSRLLGAEFVNYDDPDFVTNNPRVRAGLSGAGVAWAFQSTFIYWQPLTWLSYMLDVELYGLRPWGFHLTNLLLHAANAVVLFLALQRMTGAPWRSVFVAALFALHPLHVETVAWVSERKGVLSSLFFLLAILAYVRHAERPGWGRFVLVAVCYALGLMAKSMVITLPAVLLLLDVWPLGRVRGWSAVPEGRGRFPVQSWGRILGEKLLLLPLAVGSAVLTVSAQSHGGHMWSGDQYTLGMRMAHGVVSYAAYLRKALLPFDLAVFYPHPIVHPGWKVAGALVLLAGVTLLAVWQARRRPLGLVGWLWFVGMMLPVSGFFQTGDQALADRYTYLPLIGLFMIASWGGLGLARALNLPSRLLHLLPGLALLFCAWLAAAQARTWRNTRALFEHAVAVTGDNYVAYAVLGHEWARAGQPGEAIRFLARALEMKPSYFEGRTALAGQWAAQQQFPAAISNYQAALAINPNYADALLGLGNTLLATGQYTDAIAHLEKVIMLQPDSVPALGRLAWLLATHPEDSVRNGRRAVELAGRACDLTGHRDALLLNTLAAAYAETGQFEQATATARQALAAAQAAGQPQVAGIIDRLLAMYQARTPYRE